MDPSMGPRVTSYGECCRGRDQLFPVGLERWAWDWGTGKSPPWGLALRNTGRPGHSQCLCLGKELNQPSHRGPYRDWGPGVVPTATPSSSQGGNLPFGKVSFASQLVCSSVLWGAEGHGRSKLSLGQRIKGENRVPSLEVQVKTAEGTNSQGQLCPADSVLLRAALWWPDKEVGGPEGCWLSLWNHSQQADLFRNSQGALWEGISQRSSFGGFGPCVENIFLSMNLNIFCLYIFSPLPWRTNTSEAVAFLLAQAYAAFKA